MRILEDRGTYEIGVCVSGSCWHGATQFRSESNNTYLLGITSMKKMTIALLMGLVAVGCEKAPAKTAVAPMMDPAKMASHMAPPSAHGADAPAAVEEKKAETDAAAPAAAEPAAAEPAAVEPPAVEAPK